MVARSVLVFAIGLAACAGPDAAESALLSIDRDARARGVRVEVEGETIDSELPLAVSAERGAMLIRPDGEELLALAPGELVEIDADGTVRRGPVDPDRLVVAGTADGASSLADMLGGASVEPIEPQIGGAGRFALRAPGVTWIAASLHGLPIPDVRAASVFAVGLAAGDATWTRRVEATFAPLDARPVQDGGEGEAPDAAALVGVYQCSDVLLVLDASGGYSLRTSDGMTRGAFRPAPGGLVLEPEGGAPVAMRLWGGALIDDVGLALAPADSAAIERRADEARRALRDRDTTDYLR